MVILDKENRPNDVIRLDVNAHKGMSDMCIVIVTLTLRIIHPKQNIVEIRKSI